MKSVKLPRAVLVLGLVSLLNDIASDMIIPIMPVFFTAMLGAGPMALGFMEGLAETTASLLKMMSGRMADSGVGQKKLTLLGYLISNIARPAIGLAAGWKIAVFLRFADRAGKGVRTTPRDSIISSATLESNRGKAFGFHRSMDHTGAMIGPLAAAALLYSGAEVRDIFFLSIIPGMFAVALVAFGIKESAAKTPSAPPPPLAWKRLDVRVRAMITAAGALAFAAAPEAFLILWLSGHGAPLAAIPLIWAAGSLIRAIVALPAGKLSDKAGRAPVAVSFWTLRALFIALMPWFDGIYAATALFLGYCAASAGSEGAERALIGDKAPEDSKGSAFGLFNMITGAAALPGALWFGIAWQTLGAKAAFSVSAMITLFSAFYLFNVAVKNGEARKF